MSLRQFHSEDDMKKMPTVGSFPLEFMAIQAIAKWSVGMTEVFAFSVEVEKQTSLARLGAGTVIGQSTTVFLLPGSKRSVFESWILLNGSWEGDFYIK